MVGSDGWVLAGVREGRQWSLIKPCALSYLFLADSLRRRLTDWYTLLVRLVWATWFCFGTVIFSPWFPFWGDSNAHVVRGRRRISYLILLFC